MQAVSGATALKDWKRNERALQLLQLLAGEAGRRAWLRLHAPGRNRAAASQALAKRPGLQALQGRIDRRHFGGIAASQHLAPLAQDGSPTVNFFR